MTLSRFTAVCIACIACIVASSACGSSATLPVSAGTGPDPVLPRPREAVIPLINVVTAKGWSRNGSPVAAPGMTVRAFAKNLNHPRWVYVLPNGDVLVAETNAPKRPCLLYTSDAADE